MNKLVFNIIISVISFFEKTISFVPHQIYWLFVFLFYKLFPFSVIQSRVCVRRYWLCIYRVHIQRIPCHFMNLLVEQKCEIILLRTFSFRIVLRCFLFQKIENKLIHDFVVKIFCKSWIYSRNTTNHISHAVFNSIIPFQLAWFESQILDKLNLCFGR